MTSMLIRWFVNALALWVVCALVDGVKYESIVWLFVAALVLGLLNAVIKPILKILTLPITIVTLGLFLLVINAIMLWLAGWTLSPGFHVDGFVPALIGSVILSVIGYLTSWIGKSKED